MFFQKLIFTFISSTVFLLIAYVYIQKSKRQRAMTRRLLFHCLAYNEQFSLFHFCPSSQTLHDSCTVAGSKIQLLFL